MTKYPPADGHRLLAGLRLGGLRRGGLRRSPGGDGSQPSGPLLPTSVRRAVWLMRIGAAASTVYLIFALAVTASEKSSLEKWNAQQPKAKQLTAAEINSTATYLIVSTIIVGLIAVALWIWMARMNSRGRSWARMTSSAFFILWTVYAYSSVGSVRGPATLVVSTIIVLVIWLIGLCALFFLWRPDASEYFKSGG